MPRVRVDAKAKEIKLTRQRVVRSRTPKPSVAKATQAKAAKSSVKKSVRSSATPRLRLMERSVTVEEVTFTPGTLSVRLQEKRAVYERWLREYGPDFFASSSTYFGLVFTGISLVLSAGILSITKIDFMRGGLATVLCTDTTTCAAIFETDIPPTQGAASRSLPRIRYLSVPSELDGTQDTNIVIESEFIRKQQVSLESVETGLLHEVPEVTREGESRFFYRVPTTELSYGDYRIRIDATATDPSQTRVVFEGPVLSYRNQEEAFVIAATLTTVLTDETATTSNDLPEESIPSEDEETVSGMASEDITKQVFTSESMVVKIETHHATTAVTRVIIDPNYTYETIEVYAEPTHSAQLLFLGTATKLKSSFVYWINNASLPIASYRLVLKALDGGHVQATQTIPLPQRGALLPPKVILDDYDNNVTLKQVDAFLTDMQETVAGLGMKTILSTTVSDGEEADFTRDQNLDDATPESAFISNLRNQSDYQSLLQRYQAAYEGGQQYLYRLVEKELYRIAGSMAVVDDSSLSVREIETLLGEELQKIRDIADDVYRNVRLETGYNLEDDFDKDGLTDYIELTVYNTNPRQADSDFDGVTDAVEVIQGFDPLVAKPESVFDFESTPDRLPLHETLVIESVEPLLLYREASSEPVVFAEIRGIGLPDTFMYLSLESGEEVSVIRTDETGSFSHTISKMFRDGSYDFTLFLLDNTGEAVAKSDTFTMTKLGREFLPASVAAFSDRQTDTTSIDTSSLLQANLIASLGTMSLGLLLLVIAAGLRRKKSAVLVSSLEY